MAGLVSNAGAFFTFYLLVFSTFIALSSFFRFLGAISFSFNTAARMASILVMTMVIYSGYMRPQPAMRRWLVWLYYINPVNYSFSALMGNEFGHLDLTCDGASIVPNGPSYPSSLGPNQVCTLRGSRPGNPIVIGEDYISASYTYSKNNVWQNFRIEVAYFGLFTICLFLAVENLSLGAGMPAINVFAKENAERERLNEGLQSRKHNFCTGKAQQDLSGLIQTRKPLTWEGLPSTSRCQVGVIGGKVCIAGRAPGANFQRGTAYCEQQDVHEWTATPPQVSIEEKDAYVEEVIQLLELEDLADGMIGFPGFGLGVEARKRVTIGVELAAKPQLLLFLDEPTSGLDGQSAYNIVRFLKKLAAAGQAFLCTIHQPNALLFENFDHLLLLKKGGRCVYFGGIGKDSHILRSYFKTNGAQCPESANPAEFMLEAIGAGTSRQMGGKKDWADHWVDSEEHAENKREIERLKKEYLAKSDKAPLR
ncbi:CDR ABC transporter-domain-containing protein [Melampsora americana]|nr:CDR ABC transporter-domain-containing protein [Melampsora americana]